MTLVDCPPESSIGARGVGNGVPEAWIKLRARRRVGTSRLALQSSTAQHVGSGAARAERPRERPRTRLDTHGATRHRGVRLSSEQRQPKPGSPRHAAAAAAGEAPGTGDNGHARRAEDAAMYAKSRKVTSGLNSAIRNLEKKIKDIDEISGELGYDMAYEKLLQQPEFADEAQARIDAERQKMQRIRDVRRRKAEAYRKKKDAEEAAKKPAPVKKKKKKRRLIGAAGSGAVASRKLKERSEDAAQLVLGMDNSNAEPLEAPAPIEVPQSPINVDDPLTQAFFSGEPPVPKRRPKTAQPKKTHYDRTRRPRSAAFRIIANDNPFGNVDELFAAEAERQKQQSDKMKRLASPWGILDSDPRAGRPSSAPHHRPKPLPFATLGKGASEVVETLRRW